MSPPFIALNIHEFKRLLDGWQQRRQIDEVHMHHTWRPNHAQFRGHDSIVAMWRFHTQENGWSDIAQHVTIDPQGVIWTGRHWDLPPASSSGHNGSHAKGPFMFEMVGDFDVGGDPFRDPQRDAALWVVALVQDKFNLAPESLKFHRSLGSPKTCPGNGIDYKDVLAAVNELRGTEVPRTRQRSARIANYDPVVGAREWLGKTPGRVSDAEDAEPVEGPTPVRGVDAATGKRAAPRSPRLDPDTLQRLRPHVINLSQGLLSDSGIFQTDEGDVRRIFEEELPRRLQRLGNGEKLPIVFFAHGGLVNETAGLTIAASQVPWWVENGAYPLVFVWETGLLETLAQLIGLGREPARGVISDASDKIIEGIVRAANAQSIWQAMKFSASRAMEPDGGGTLVLRHLGKFLESSKDKVRLNAVGHSAGSIFHSYMLPKLFELHAAPIESVSLLAPAITVADFKARLAPHVGSAIRRLVMFTMNKDAELADTVTPLYRKSLLYLINRALEPRAGEPILGLEESVRADSDLRKLLGLGGRSGKAAVVWSPTALSTGRRASGSLTHGDFDNNPATMESVAREVLDLPDAAPVVPFPVDREPRQAPLQPRPPIQGDAASFAAAAPAIVMPPAAASSSGTGSRRALCVGIDEYPDPGDRLYGCVADAHAWEAAFASLGFQVERLHNAAATRQRVLERLANLVRAANSGDTIALQFAAHGTQLDDIDGDEQDGKDEAFCPVDYAQGQFIVDDDFRDIFAGLKLGVTFTCFFDTCHSGTITRLGVGRAATAAGSRPRYIFATDAMNRAHARFRATLGSSRAPASAERSAMRQVVFAACNPNETALETGGRGDFSVRAVPLLTNAGRVSNKRFAELVRAAFGQSPRQHPNLDCEISAEGRSFLFAGGAPDHPQRGLDGEVRTGSTDRAADLVMLAEVITRLSR